MRRFVNVAKLSQALISLLVLASFAVLSGSALSGDTLSRKKSSAEYWKETGVDFGMLDQQINQENCYQSLEVFMGCISSLNSIFGFGKRPLALIPTSLLNAEKHQLIAEYSKQASLVEYVIKKAEKKDASGAKDTDFAANKAKFKKELAETHTAWKQIFESGSKELDFDNITYRAELYGRSVVLDTPVASDGTVTINEPLMAASALNQFIETIADPHSGITPTAEVEDHGKSEGEHFFGIGASLKPAPEGVLIQNVIEDSPALAAGLRARDLVTQVEGVVIKGKAVDSIVSMIRGPEGTLVKLTIIRDLKEQVITVKRGAIKFENVSSKTLEMQSTKVGYIRLRGFMEDAACAKIKAEVKNRIADHVQSLILDLRGNPGGRMDYSVCIANIFLKKNLAVVEQRPLPGMPPQIKQVVFNTKEDALTDLPMVTLIDASSASASEIVSGALQDHKRSLIVGVRSFGKATIQSIGPMPQNPKITIKTTIARFYLPSGRTNQVTGITPDITVYAVPNATENDKVEFREEDLYTNALPPMGPEWKQPRPDFVKSIVGCLEKNDTAQAAYTRGQSEAILPDFQLLVAKDVAYCLSIVKKK